MEIIYNVQFFHVNFIVLKNFAELRISYSFVKENLDGYSFFCIKVETAEIARTEDECHPSFL
jgi:hypothetical protein